MAYDGTRPRDDDFVKESAALIRANLEGLRTGGLVAPKPTLFGAGWPASTLGASFDRYINQNNGDVFYKSYSGTWIRVLNLGSIYKTTAGFYYYATRAELTSAVGTVGDLGIIDGDLVQHFYIKESTGWTWKSKVPKGSEQYQDMGSISGTKNINAASGTIVKFTVAATLTITLTAVADTGLGCTLTLLMRKGGAYKVTWPSSVAWAGGITPTFSMTETDVVTLTTINGSDWIGTVAGAAATAETIAEAHDVVSLFTASGSVVAPSWATKVLITGCGGGGGGGGGLSNANIVISRSGGGGSAGCAIKYPKGVTGGATYKITIGAGGAAGALNSAGGTGGVTSFGSLLSLSGGEGGAVAYHNGSAHGADVKGVTYVALEPRVNDVDGGNSVFGKGGVKSITERGAGVAGWGYGSAGSGAVGAYAGAAGCNGFLILEWVA